MIGDQMKKFGKNVIRLNKGKNMNNTNARFFNMYQRECVWCGSPWNESLNKCTNKNCREKKGTLE